jgi:hypothetical protein
MLNHMNKDVNPMVIIKPEQHEQQPLGFAAIYGGRRLKIRESVVSIIGVMINGWLVFIYDFF